VLINTQHLVVFTRFSKFAQILLITKIIGKSVNEWLRTGIFMYGSFLKLSKLGVRITHLHHVRHKMDYWLKCKVSVKHQSLTDEIPEKPDNRFGGRVRLDDRRLAASPKPEWENITAETNAFV